MYFFTPPVVGILVVVVVVVVVVVTISCYSVSYLRFGSLHGKSLNMLLNTKCAGNLKECFRLIFVVIVHVRFRSRSISLFLWKITFMCSHIRFLNV